MDTRLALWSRLVAELDVRSLVEVGVFEGAFAAHLLRECPAIRRYYMLDPWRHLEGWNKPANQSDDEFARIHARAVQRTAFAAERRTVLRGTTTEVSNQIPDGALDFAYVDGDHTLRGITIDLIRVFPKIRRGGWIGGDDCCRSIWQHGPDFEPTLVYPFVVHFAEAVGGRLYCLPDGQFLLHKREDDFGFVDLTGRFDDVGLRHQMQAGGWRRWARRARSLVRRVMPSSRRAGASRAEPAS